MPQMTIQLRCDPESGRREIIVKLHSDADALPHEHEQLHRRIVDRLLEGGVISVAERGHVVIEREDGTVVAGQADGPSAEERPPVSEGR